MKKNYIHPEAIELNVVTEPVLALSEGDGRGDDDIVEATDDRRGSWGNVWGK